MFKAEGFGRQTSCKGGRYIKKRSLGLSGIMMTFTLNVPGPKLGVWKNLKIGQEFGHILCMT